MSDNYEKLLAQMGVKRMKSRTGKECKKSNCVNYEYYSNWARNLGCGTLKECMECKNAHVSQYRRKER